MSVAELVHELVGWPYHHDLDLTGFVDGTENPTVVEATQVAIIEDGRPGAGSSILLLQQWEHDAIAWEQLPVAAQEAIMGRRKADSAELDPVPPDSHVGRTDQEVFGKIPDISVDYAVMERSDRVAVVPATFAWSDVGSWKAVSELTPPDQFGNRTEGEAVFVDSHDCYVQSDSRMVAAVGVDDLMIVDTPDALLVASRDHVQDVKKVAQQLKLAQHPTHLLHRTVVRPWGTYTVLEEGAGFKIKRIVVKPGASLSLQMHYHRSEHWIVVSGTAKVVNGEREFLVRTNESTYIPAGTRHRLENPGKVPLVMIEVQSGGYLGEDDIVRFEDKYGRA